MKQEYGRLSTDADLSLVSLQWAMGDPKKHRELHVSPTCEAIAEEVCIRALMEMGIQIDRVVDDELGPHEWFLLETIGSPG
jgi:hypothetical protein